MTNNTKTKGRDKARAEAARLVDRLEAIERRGASLAPDHPLVASVPASDDRQARERAVAELVQAGPVARRRVARRVEALDATLATAERREADRMLADVDPSHRRRPRTARWSPSGAVPGNGGGGDGREGGGGNG